MLTGAGWIAGVGARRGVDGREMAKSDLIVVWGGNPVSTQVNVMTHITLARRERGAKLVVVDPYRTASAAAADMHLAPLPGTDGALACAVMHVLFKEGYADRDYMARYADDPEGLEAHLATREPGLGGGDHRLVRRRDRRFRAALRPHQAQLYPRRLRLFALAQRLGAAVRGDLPADRDRRLAIRGRRRAVVEPWSGAARPHPARRARRARPVDPHARPVAHRPVLTGDRRDLGDGPPVTALFIQNTNPMVVARNPGSCAAALPATICSSASTSSS